MIRILHVFGRLDRGGAETMVMNLYRNMDRSKIQFDFVVHTTDKCDYDDEIKNLGGRIHHISNYNGKNHLRYKQEWNNFFKQHPEYKTIHGHVRSTAAIYLKVAKKYGLTTIAHSHNTSSGNGLSAIVKNIMQYPIRNISDYLLACSEYAGKWLFGEKACKKDRFFILKNAINVKEFEYNQETRHRKRNEFNLEGKLVIGNVARFHPQKNHSFLIDIFQKIHAKNKDAVLMLVGQGELQTEISKKVEDLGLSNNVIFTGVRSDIPELMQAMDVFVFPSLFEGLGIVTVEAQATGLKCIVADTIPKEAFVTDLIESISLNETPEKWANKILESAVYERRDTFKEIYNSGYEIKETSKWLENFYLQNA